MNVEQLLMGSAVMMATQQRCILQLCLSTRFPWNYMVSLAPSGRNRASRDNATTVTSMECSTNFQLKKPMLATHVEVLCCSALDQCNNLITIGIHAERTSIT